MTRIGWCPGDHTMSDMLGLYPRSSAVRVFFGPGEGLPVRPWSDPAWPNFRQRLSQLPPGCTVIVSHKDQNVDAAAFVEAWLKYRPDVLLDLVAHHEPEQQSGGDPTPTQFRASWTRQRQQVGGHPARADGRLRLAVCWTLQWIRAGGNWRTWYPDHEADAVDLVLFDWYQYEPGAPNPYRPRSYEDPASALAKMLEISAATGKPWGIAEVDHLRITKANGFAVDLDPTGEMCAAWYRRFFAAAKVAGCRVWCHFHRGHGDLTSRLPEQQALRDLIEQEATVTTAPDNLKAVRTLLLDELGPHGLDPLAVGIVGDPDHWGGYHCGEDRVVRDDYSVVESSRDSAGLTDDASGLDVGLFSYRAPDGKVHNLRTFSVWCVAECAAGAPDTRDIREIIYSPDGEVVKRWDRLGKRTSGDSSHRGHTHFSFFRDSTKAGRDQTPLFRRYLTTIGLLEDDMTPEELLGTRLPDPVDGQAHTVGDYLRYMEYNMRQQLAPVLAEVKALRALVGAEGTNPTELAGALAALPQPQPVDVDQLAGALTERLKAALPADAAVTDEQLARVLRDVLGSLDDSTPQG